jgi:protein-disulfide isomerase
MGGKPTTAKAVLYAAVAFAILNAAGSALAANEPVPQAPVSTVLPAPSDRVQFEQIIREYLLVHPEVIRDALIILQKRELELQNKSRVAAIRENSDLLFHKKTDATLGNSNGSVQIAEFVDYNCGYCRAAHPDVAQLVAEKPDVRIVVKQFPILGLDSVEAARVAIAVNMIAPERFAEFHSRMYELKGRVTAERAKEVAVGLGIETTSIAQPEGNTAISAEIARNMDLAKRMGITGTPSFVSADSVLAGSVGLKRLRDLVTKVEATEPAVSR